MNKIKILCALSLILTVSACSSSGGGGSSKSNNGGSSIPAVPIDLSEAPSPGTREPVTASTVARVEAALDRLQMETAGGSLTAVAPTAAATLRGYIRVAGRNSDEIIFGNLELNVAFTDGTLGVKATAGDFSAFTNPDNPVPVEGDVAFSLDTSYGGILEGSRPLTGTGFTTTLTGDIGSRDGNFFNIRANLRGDFYQENGRLVTYGTVTSEDGATTGLFSSGDFAASE